MICYSSHNLVRAAAAENAGQPGRVQSVILRAAETDDGRTRGLLSVDLLKRNDRARFIFFSGLCQTEIRHRGEFKCTPAS